MAAYPVQIPPHAGAQLDVRVPPGQRGCRCVRADERDAGREPGRERGCDGLVAVPDGGSAGGGPPGVVTVPQGTSWLIPVIPEVYGPSVVLTYTGTLTTAQVAVISFSE